MLTRINNEPMRLLYRFSRYCIYLVLRMLYRIRAEGVENVPSDGGVMVASNHASMLDPPCVGVCIPREITYFAKKELFSIPGFGQFIAAVNSLPVDRRGFSRSALKEIIDRLKAGWAVLIFPEGTRTRTGDFLEPKSGAGMIAVTADTLIVPCWVEGSYRAKPFFSRITVHFLPPFKPSEIVAETKKDHYLLVSKRIMYDITNLYKTHMAVRNEAKSKEQ